MQPDLFKNSQTGSSGDAKAAEASRARRAAGSSRSSKTMLRVSLLLGAFVAAAGIGAFAAARYLSSSARYRLATVHLSGQHFVAQSEVDAKFLDDRARSIVEIPLDKRRREIEQIAWVRSASVQRVLPDQLWVSIQERTPVAFVWTPAGAALADADGVIMDYPTEGSFSLPVVRGISEQDSPAMRRAKMQHFTDLMSQVNFADAGEGWSLSEVDVGDLQDVQVVVSDPNGAVLLHMGAENFRQRYAVYARNVVQWRQQFPSIESVDLRYEDQAVINSRPLDSPVKGKKAVASSKTAGHTLARATSSGQTR